MYVLNGGETPLPKSAGCHIKDFVPEKLLAIHKRTKKYSIKNISDFDVYNYVNGAYNYRNNFTIVCDLALLEGLVFGNNITLVHSDNITNQILILDTPRWYYYDRWLCVHVDKDGNVTYDDESPNWCYKLVTIEV